MEKSIDIAVIGATGLVGSAMLERLADSELPIGQVYPLASERSDGKTVSYGNHQLSVHVLDKFDFKQVQLCFFCVPAEVSEQFIDKASVAGCYSIDFSSYSRLRSEIPLLVAGVNNDRLQELAGKVVASPDSSVIHLAQILAPMTQLTVIERINAVLLRAVSEVGRAGIEELSEQSIALFNLKPIVSKHFAQQIAFNVLPHSCHTRQADQLSEELQLELRKVMQDEALSLNVTLVQVPVFYGHSMSLQLEFSDELPISKVKDLIAGTTVLKLIDQDENRPNTVSDAVNQDGVYLGCLRQDPTWHQGVNLWAVADNVHQGAAINGVQVAEILVKDYL